MSFPIQQVSCDNNIETGKVLNLFDDCVAECVPVLPGGTGKYTLGTMANSQTDRAPTEIDKNGAVVKVRILLELRTM